MGELWGEQVLLFRFLYGCFIVAFWLSIWFRFWWAFFYRCWVVGWGCRFVLTVCTSSFFCCGIEFLWAFLSFCFWRFLDRSFLVSEFSIWAIWGRFSLLGHTLAFQRWVFWRRGSDWFWRVCGWVSRSRCRICGSRSSLAWTLGWPFPWVSFLGWRCLLLVRYRGRSWDLRYPIWYKVYFE